MVSDLVQPENVIAAFQLQERIAEKG